MMRGLGCTLSGSGRMQIGKRLMDPTNGAHKNSDDQAMRSSRDPKRGWKKKGRKRREKKKRKLSQKMRAREDPEHARIVRHKIRGCDVERGLTFALADARSVQEARGVRRSGNSHIFFDYRSKPVEAGYGTGKNVKPVAAESPRRRCGQPKLDRKCTPVLGCS